MPTDEALPPGPAPTRPPARGGRWIRLALGLSLAMNVAVLGVVAGAFLRDPPPRDPGARPGPFGPFGAVLDERDRRALRDAFRARAPEIREARAALRDDMRALAAALRTDPMDAAAIRAALERGAARSGEMIRMGQQLLFERFTTLSAAERSALADRLEAEVRQERGPRRD